jgi:glyoxylase-like metal-dependent hydrolase (beta-lactamase superfamily II)
MFLKKLIVGAIETNCYLLACPETKKAVVIDPAGESERIKKVIIKNKLEVVFLINTHGHLDHILANREIKEETSAKLLIHQADAKMLADPVANLSSLFGSPFKSPPPDILLKEGDLIKFGQFSLRVLHTPGHTPGSISLLLEPAQQVLFTGDTLFAGGIGRYDFPGASYEALKNSILKKLFSYPGETVIYPGHGPPSTIGQEKISLTFS